MCVCGGGGGSGAELQPRVSLHGETEWNGLREKNWP